MGFRCLFFVALWMGALCCTDRAGVGSDAAHAARFYPDTTEQHVRRLLTQAAAHSKNGDDIAALNCMQMALSMEKGISPNTSLTFDLNRQMGFALAEFSPRYALIFLKKALAINEALVRDQGNVIISGTLAGIHMNLREPDSAQLWYRRAIKFAFADSSRTVAQATTLNNLGFFFARNGQRDSAMHCFLAADSTLHHSAKKAEVLYCSIQDNIAQVLEQQGDFASALRTYRVNDSVYRQEKRPAKALANFPRLFNARYHIGQQPTPSDFAAGGRLIAANRQDLSDKDVLNFYQYAKNYFFETQNLVAARRYELLYSNTKGEIDQQIKTKTDLLINAYLNTQAIRFQQEAEMYRIESGRTQQTLATTRIMAILGLLLLLLITGFGAYFLQRRRRELDLAHRLATAELRAKELEAQAMTQTLNLQKRDITTVALHNTQVIDNSRRMVTRLNEIARKKENVAQAIGALVQELQNQEQLSERVQMVQENIDRVNAEFYQALKTQFPMLTKTEIELCGYLRVALSNKDIALLKNIAPASVKMAKNRLRKKLGLNERDDLLAFMQGI